MVNELRRAVDRSEGNMVDSECSFNSEYDVDLMFIVDYTHMLLSTTHEFTVRYTEMTKDDDEGGG